jgi:integrase
LWRGLERNYKPTAERTAAAERTFRRFAAFAAEYCREHGGSCETVDEITPEMAAAWFTAIRDAYSWGTARPMWQLMRSSWTRWHVYASSNPFATVVVRNREASAAKVERRPLTEEELARLFEITEEKPELHALVVAAACTGMRIGDVCRLKWADVDLRGGLIEATTAKAGVRVTVPIFAPLAKVLAGLHAKHAEGDSPYVFPLMAAQYNRVNAGGFRNATTGIYRQVKPYFARAVFLDEEPAPAALADAKPKSREEVLAAIDGAGFALAKRDRVREVYTRYVNGEKCAEIAAALNLARGQVSDYLKEIEQLTGETYRPRIERKRAAGKPSNRDLVRRTRAARAIGKHSASLYGWHNLRHTFVVLALQAGVPVNDVARIVGHGDVATTLNNYGNTSREVVAERTRRQMRGTVLAEGEAVPMIEGAAIVADAAERAALPAPAKSTADRLRELKALADEGLISDEEYAAKRSDILAVI